MRGTATFNHPLKPEDITEENYREVADHLFRRQLLENVDYHKTLLKYGWSDDDTDYLRTALNATESLMDLAYDHSRDDLIYFLFTPRKKYEEEMLETNRMEPLHFIDSAGGLCAELMAYSELLHRKEEEDEARD